MPLTPPPLEGLLADVDARSVIAARDATRKYLHWDDVFHRSPPDGLTTTRWWASLKLSRILGAQPLPLRGVDGLSFWYTSPGELQEMLVRLDQQLAGRIGASDQILNPASRDRYLISSLSEEAITSSQLEGASTSRRVAKEMLRTGRPPKDRGERMIANNFRAMQFVREHSTEPLTPDLVAEIQRIVTDGTLDDPDDAGRLQPPGDTRVRVWGDNDEILHTPPPAEELPERMRAMCAFANGGGDQWIHPVVRAVALHFWLGYDHPFADGNGRTARVLFYWSMLRAGYWLTEYVSISTILRRAHADYERAYLLTETDENDLTYFLLHQCRVIVRATEALFAYVDRKAAEVREVETLMKVAWRFNHRQRALLGHALRNLDAAYTIESHRRSHGVVYQTARTDLLELADAGVLVQRKAGKAYRFSPAPDLANQLQDV